MQQTNLNRANMSHQNTPEIRAFFDNLTNTFSYVVTDLKTKRCAVIDSVLNFDPVAIRTSTVLADEIITYIEKNQFQVQWILETHVHADHLSAAQYIQSKLGGKIAISEKIEKVQRTFSKIYHLDADALIKNQTFDILFKDGESFKIGELSAYNIPTPGHTPACLSYVIGENVFVGDTLFMYDYGTARCDFPEGNAGTLFDSVQRLYQLPDHFKIYLCHDYLPNGRTEYQYVTTILDQKTKNIHIRSTSDKPSYISMREKRDAQLSLPKLMLPAIQINMRAGKLPIEEPNGISYLKLPINYFK